VSQDDGSAAARASDPIQVLLRRVERERLARKRAEELLEGKSAELFRANQQLQTQAARLELTVRERTQALEQALANMNRAMRAKSEFLAVVSHEIRTPMNGILGMTQLLQMSALDEEQRRFVGVIQTSGETLLSIINDILDMSKLEAGKFKLHSRPFEPRVVAREVGDLLRSQAQSKRLYLDIEIAERLPQWLQGDGLRLTQVLTNLVGNALKFTHHGGVTVTLEMSDDATMLECVVQDTGIGIPPDRVNSLFERFSQVDSSITRRYGGTGLGLAICKHLVEGMGGTIGVRSKMHEGSTFTVRIPAPVAQPEAPAQGNPAPAAPRRELRVLLVEDNAVNQLLAMTMLNKLGYQGDLAADGAEALERVKSVDYDVVLMDMQMPRMDGLTATRAIRQLPLAHQPRIVALTANAMDADRETCLQAGMDDFLAKPFKAGELREKIERTADARS